MRRRAYLLGVVFLTVAPIAGAQQIASQNLGTQDSTLPAPKRWAESGNVDPQALSMLMKAGGAGSSSWHGFQAQGTIAYGSSSQRFSATLTCSEDGATRLDVETPQGLFSSRIAEASGGVQMAEARVERMEAIDALRGLFLWPGALMRSAQFTKLGIRRGTPAIIGGETLNNISISRPLPAAIKSPDLGVPEVVTDLYLSESTGMLTKTVDMVHGIGLSPHLYKRVVTYSHYQNVENVPIPTRYELTLDGQQSWTLDLSTVSAVPQSVGAEYFRF